MGNMMRVRKIVHSTTLSEGVSGRVSSMVIITFDDREVIANGHPAFGAAIEGVEVSLLGGRVLNMAWHAAPVTESGAPSKRPAGPMALGLLEIGAGVREGDPSLAHAQRTLDDIGVEEVDRFILLRDAAVNLAVKASDRALQASSSVAPMSERIPER